MARRALLLDGNLFCRLVVYELVYGTDRSVGRLVVVALLLRYNKPASPRRTVAREAIGNSSCSDSYRSSTQRDVLEKMGSDRTRGPPPLVRRRGRVRNADQLPKRGLDVSKRVFREFLREFRAQRIELRTCTIACGK